MGRDREVDRDARIDEESRERAAWQLTARHKEEYESLRREHAARMRGEQADREIKRGK